MKPVGFFFFICSGTGPADSGAQVGAMMGVLVGQGVKAAVAVGVTVGVARSAPIAAPAAIRKTSDKSVLVFIRSPSCFNLNLCCHCEPLCRNHKLRHKLWVS